MVKSLEWVLTKVDSNSLPSLSVLKGNPEAPHSSVTSSNIINPCSWVSWVRVGGTSGGGTAFGLPDLSHQPQDFQKIPHHHAGQIDYSFHPPLSLTGFQY